MCAVSTKLIIYLPKEKESKKNWLCFTWIIIIFFQCALYTWFKSNLILKFWRKKLNTWATWLSRNAIACSFIVEIRFVFEEITGFRGANVRIPSAGSSWLKQNTLLKAGVNIRKFPFAGQGSVNAFVNVAFGFRKGAASLLSAQAGQLFLSRLSATAKEIASFKAFVVGVPRAVGPFVALVHADGGRFDVDDSLQSVATAAEFFFALNFFAGAFSWPALRTSGIVDGIAALCKQFAKRTGQRRDKASQVQRIEGELCAGGVRRAFDSALFVTVGQGEVENGATPFPRSLLVTNCN